MRARLRPKGVLGTWRRRIFFGLVIFAIIAWLVISPLGQQQQANQAESVSKISLQTEKKVYQLAEKPTLLLRFPRAGKAVGFLQLLQGQSVYAASVPHVEVDYNNDPANVSASVTSQGGNFLITIQHHAQLKPGTYTVKVNGETTSGQAFSRSTTFAWGVLAVNTDKSIYLPGETAHLQVAVLDSLGHTLCAAPIQITITNPSGTAQHVPYQPSGSCHGDGFTTAPDYTAAYTVGGVGRYKITLGIQNTAYSITSYFKVSAHMPFDITCNSVTRIYPLHAYGMGINVVANQNFKGTATETISNAQFTIFDSPGATIRKESGKTIISWQVNWEQGQQYNLSYQYLAPPISPALYTLGPLQLSENGHVIFQEARAWQLAADATITLVKQTETNVTTAANTHTTSVTSTAGDTLVLLVAINTTGTSTGISSVTDSASNTWNYATVPPSQDPPANYATSTSSLVAIAYATNASAITSITVAIRGTAEFYAFDLLEFSNIDNVNPVGQSASNDNETANTTHTTPTTTVTTCDSPTTSQLMRNGDYFCTSVNELIIGMVNAGNNASGYTLTTSGFTSTTALVPTTGSDEAAGAYLITPTSGSYSIGWTTGTAKKDATAIMVFQQNGNTSGGDQQYLFWG